VGTTALSQKAQVLTNSGFSTEGAEEIVRALEALGPYVFANVLARATKVAVQPAVEAARRALVTNKSVETGLLKESIGDKQKKYKRSGVVVSLLGARRGFKRQVGEKSASARQAWRTGKTTRAIYRNPQNYAHLVESGHRTRSGSMVQGKPFLGPAFRANRSRMIAVLEESLGKKIAAKYKQMAKGK
jgi:hypothetical protein